MSGENRFKKFILDLFIIIFAAAAIVCGGVSFLHFDQLEKNDEYFKKLSYKSYTKLKKQNGDMIGWLKMKGTKINYPVMYTPTDPEFYLHHDFDKNYSVSGTLFVAGGTDLEMTHNILIYGHHMMDGSMFGNLQKYIDDGKTKFRFDILKSDDGSLYERRTYKVIAAFKTSTNYPQKYYIYQDIEDNEAFEEYKKLISEANELGSPVECKYPDDLITLSTCSYHLWSGGKLDHSGRYVVVAKKISSRFITSK